MIQGNISTTKHIIFALKFFIQPMRNQNIYDFKVNKNLSSLDNFKDNDSSHFNYLIILFS